MPVIKVIKPEQIINLQLNGHFYKRLQDFATSYSLSVPVEKLHEQLLKITEKEELDEFGYHLETLLILIKGIEDEAVKQNAVVDLTIEDAPVDNQNLPSEQTQDSV